MPDLRVRGSATAYRVFDIGYAIALDRVAGLLAGTPASRSRPGRSEAQTIEIPNPPLVVPLGNRTCRLEGRESQGAVSARLFHFGSCSMRMTVSQPTDVSWAEFTALGTAVSASKDIESVLDAELHALVDRIRDGIERPAIAPVVEEYVVFRIDQIRTDGDAASVSARLTDEQLVPLLLGERRPLSEGARRELLPYRFSYHDDDLTVLTWDNALVVEPRPDDHDVEYVLEFANAQLVELRLFDLQLDADLPAIYHRVEAARAKRLRLSGRFRAVLADLQTRVADITKTVERVENAFKLTNDVYLARIYDAALQLFREQAWRRGIERKLRILRETYEMLNSEAQVARAEALEIAIVVLIVAELLLGVLRG
jgi:hypothetical protein